MIEISHVSKSYGSGSKAIRDLSLTIDDGEFVFITGRSGSGKSTLIKLLMKELDPTKGTIPQKSLSTHPRGDSCRFKGDSRRFALLLPLKKTKRPADRA